jgi:predicted MFS family arabinose efflux permease
LTLSNHFAKVKSVRRESLFFHHDFRRLWAGETVAEFGTFVGQTVLPILAATVLAATPFQMGVLTAAETAAFLLVGLPAGVWVDRMRRRRLMLRADFIRSGLLLTVPIAWWTGWLTLTQLIVVALVVGVATVFFDIAYQSYLPSLVSRERLLEGNSKLQASQAMAQVVGPGIGGVLTQLAGAANAVLVTGAGFATSAICLLRIKAADPDPEPHENPRIWPQIAEGLRFVFGNRNLRAIVCATGTSNFAGGALTAVQVLFLIQDVGLPPAAVGIMLTSSGAGGVLAALTSNSITRRIGQARAIWFVPMLTWPAALLVPFAAPGWRIGLAVAGPIVYSFGGIVYNIAQVSYRQTICPDRLLGRMNASVRFVVWGTIPLGGLAGGALGEWLGLRGTVWVAAVLLALAMVWLLCSPLRHLRDIPLSPAETPLTRR